MRRPSPLIVLAVALLLASCGSDGKRGTASGAYRYGTGGGTTSTAVAADNATGTPATTVKKSGGATATSAASGTTRPREDGGTASPTTTGIRPLPTTVPGDDGSQGPPGAFARTLLRPQPATAVVLERFEQQGAAPRQGSLDHATKVLGDVTAKPVSGAGPVGIDGGAKDWTAEELRTTADKLSAAGQGNGRAVLHALFLHGTFEGNNEVLGVTVRGDVLAIFIDVIADSATPIVSRSQIEDAVLTHELGHTLGLVDLARDTGRADPQHPGHSKNTQSVMYWAVESSLVGQVLNGPPPRDFDNDDLADLRALRNGA